MKRVQETQVNLMQLQKFRFIAQERPQQRWRFASQLWMKAEATGVDASSHSYAEKPRQKLQMPLSPKGRGLNPNHCFIYPLPSQHPCPLFNFALNYSTPFNVSDFLSPVPNYPQSLSSLV